MINEQFISILIYYVDTYSLTHTHTHTTKHAAGEWDKILIRSTTQRHLDNQEDNDVDVKTNNL